jgi:hypothetical protein
MFHLIIPFQSKHKTWLLCFYNGWSHNDEREPILALQSCRDIQYDDTHHNDTHHNDIHPNDAHHNDRQHNDIHCNNTQVE